MRSRRVVDILRRYRKSAGRSAVPTGALRAVAGEPLVGTGSGQHTQCGQRVFRQAARGVQATA